MDLEGLHDSGRVCDINSQERLKTVYWCGVRHFVTPPVSHLRLTTGLGGGGGVKGGNAAEEVMVTDAHLGCENS